MRFAHRMVIAAVLGLPACLLSASAGAVGGSVTEMVSVSSSGKQETGRTFGTGLSGDGRFVAFWSDAGNLSAMDADPLPDVFLHDRQTGATQLVTRGVGGVPAAGSVGSDGYGAALSDDGRYVVYESTDTNLVVGDTNQRSDVFVWDSQAGTTERVSVATDGAQANSQSGLSSISDDGTKIAFSSSATGLTGTPTPAGSFNIYVRDRITGQTTLASIDGNGLPSDEAVGSAMSADGRYVLFRDDPTAQLFVRDLTAGTSTLVSINVNGTPVLAAGGLSMSDDGHLIAFMRQDGALLVRNLTTSASTIEDSPPAGAAWADGPYGPALSGDGSVLLYRGRLVGSTKVQVFRRDLASGVVTTISRSITGGVPNGNSDGASVSDDGQTVGWASAASDLVSGDNNGDWDMFVRGPDTYPPAITSAPTPRLVAHSQAGLKTTPVTVSWSARDASGVCVYALSASVNGGVYTPVTLRSPTATSRAFAMADGADPRQYQVSATDCASNPASTLAGPVFLASRYQEANPHVAYKGVWHRGSSKTYAGGHDRYATQKGARATVSFTGRSVAWVAPTSAIRGSAVVYIDGKQVATVSLASAKPHQRQLIYTKTFATSGAHTLRIVNRGPKRVDLDEMLVLT